MGNKFHLDCNGIIFMKYFFIFSVALLVSMTSFSRPVFFQCNSMGKNFNFQYNGNDLIRMSYAQQGCDMKLDPTYRPNTLKDFLRFKTTSDYGYCKMDTPFEVGGITIDGNFLKNQYNHNRTEARLKLTGDGQTRETKILCWK